MILKIAVYCRVSTNSEQQETSFENQQTYFEEKIRNSNNELFGIYADKGISGTKLSRPEFNKMLYDAGVDVVKVKGGRDNYIPSNRIPLFDEIWLKNTSRFARNTLSSEIIDILRKKKVYVFFIEQNINTRENTDFFLKLYQIFDEQDSKDKSLKVLTGQAESRRKGVIFSNGKIYGYHYDVATNSLKKIEDEAKIVKLIFDWYSKGDGIRVIVNRLNDIGFRTRNNKQWCKSSVSKILKNEKYAGLNNAGKYTKGTVFNKQPLTVKDDYTVTRCDRIEAIISEEQFYSCQKILRRKVDTYNKDKPKGVNIGYSKWVGILYCGKCGSSYTSNQYKYNCSNKKLHGLNACDNQNVLKKDLEHWFSELVSSGNALQILQRQVELEKEYFVLPKLAEIEEKRKLANISGAELENRLATTKIRYQRAYEGYINASDDADVLKGIYEKYKTEYDNIRTIIKDKEKLDYEYYYTWYEWVYSEKKRYNFDKLSEEGYFKILKRIWVYDGCLYPVFSVLPLSLRDAIGTYYPNEADVNNLVRMAENKKAVVYEYGDAFSSISETIKKKVREDVKQKYN